MPRRVEGHGGRVCGVGRHAGRWRGKGLGERRQRRRLKGLRHTIRGGGGAGRTGPTDHARRISIAGRVGRIDPRGPRLRATRGGSVWGRPVGRWQIGRSTGGGRQVVRRRGGLPGLVCGWRRQQIPHAHVGRWMG